MPPKRLTSKNTDEKTAHCRLDRSTFLKQALRVIGQTGKGWIGVHELTKLMGVTTGSFYWHFKNRGEFVTALLQYWAEDFNYRLRFITETAVQNPRDQLLRLAKIITSEHLGSQDLSMRAWALREKVVAQCLKEVDHFRYKFVQSLFQKIGFKGQELESRTCTYVCYLSLETSLNLPLTAKKRQDLIKPLVQLLTSR